MVTVVYLKCMALGSGTLDFVLVLKFSRGWAWWKGLPAVDREKGSHQPSTSTSRKLQPAFFGIRACWRSLCQKYLKMSKFWKIKINMILRFIWLHFLLYIDHEKYRRRPPLHFSQSRLMSSILLFSIWSMLSTSILQPFSSRPSG